MSWLLSLLAAAISGLVGLLVTGGVAIAYADWYQVSNREGAAGFFVIGMALLGGIASCILGLIVARVVASGSSPGFRKAFAFSTGPVLALGGLAVLACRWFADIPPKIDGEELNLEVEIRLPAGRKVPTAGSESEPRFVLGSVAHHTQRASQTGELKVARSRLEDGRWIVPAEVFLFTSRGLRSIDARVGEESLAGFLVPLPAHPDREFEQWSDWEPRPITGHPPDAKPAYRFRVRRISPPPPPPTEAEFAAKQEASDQAAFDAIASDAPISVWLPYTPEWQNENRRTIALERITGREGYQAELGALMVDADARQAEAALRLIGQLSTPDPALVPLVSAAGRDLIERLQRVNATTAEEDPGYEGAGDVAIRFSCWMAAVRALREKGQGDFTPELREILELSRVRTDSQAIRQDIRRVASYYLKTWAGVEPLPGDPPPR